MPLQDTISYQIKSPVPNMGYFFSSCLPVVFMVLEHAMHAARGENLGQV